MWIVSRMTKKWDKQSSQKVWKNKMKKEADDWKKEEWEVESDKLASKDSLGHWSEELDVEKIVGGRVEKKEEVEGKMGQVGELVKAEEMVDWIKELEEEE